MKHRLPRLVHLGLGYKIKVMLVSQKVLQELADDDGRDEGQSFDGLWMEEAKTIYIDRRLSAAERRATYWHELIHALNDTIAEDRPAPLVL